MVSVLWVSLRSSWKLADVQAGLQVVIAVLSCLGIFAFSRFCWQLSSHHVKKNRAVALASLMSINTIGEAFDAAVLLRQRIFRQRYWKILAQSVVVILLTVSTIVSGPIAKASTRLGTIVRIIDVPGSLATNVFASRSYANVAWNDTMVSLDRADFPQDQLLDYLPRTNVTWLYRANEWNSTWHMNCSGVDSTPITLVDTGNCHNFSTEFPAINDIFPWNSFDHQDNYWQALNWNSTWTQDVLAVFTGWTYPGYDSESYITYNMTTTIVALHMHWLNATGESSNCQFGPGPVESASYTKIVCDLKRPHDIPDESHVAYPDSGDYWALSNAYVENWYDRFNTEANTNSTITPITPRELTRFYQAYTITKDLQYPQPVTRQLTANIQVVQLSSTFIAFTSIFAAAVLAGLIHHGIFAYRHRGIIHEIPESKLDWIVQSIMDGAEAHTTARASHARRSVIAPVISTEADLRDSEKLRAAFESAKYSANARTEEVFLTRQQSDVSAASPYIVNGLSPGFEMTPTAYTPMANQNNPLHNINPYQAAFLQQENPNRPNDWQNPDGHVYSADTRRGYAKLTGLERGP